jgi:hypothetical protein
MRLSRQQLADNEAKIRAAMARLLNGGIPPGGKCDIKTLAGAAGVDRTAFYGSRPYAHLRAEFEQRLKELRDAGGQPDPRDAQVTRCCPALKIPMKAAFTMPMWWCVKAPLPWWLRGFGGGAADGCG